MRRARLALQRQVAYNDARRCKTSVAATDSTTTEVKIFIWIMYPLWSKRQVSLLQIERNITIFCTEYSKRLTPSNLVHASWLVVKYDGQLTKNLSYKWNLSKFKGHVSSIFMRVLIQGVIVATNTIIKFFFLLKTIVPCNSGQLKKGKHV